MVDLNTANGMMTGDWAVSWVEDLLNKPELTPAGKILLLLDEAPRCGCGASCALLRYLTGQMTVIRKHESYQQRPKPSLHKPIRGRRGGRIEEIWGLSSAGFEYDGPSPVDDSFRTTSCQISELNVIQIAMNAYRQ